MSDITMCHGGTCEQRGNCHRFTAMPNEYSQSYFIMPPEKDGECEQYWNDKGYVRYNREAQSK